ncbi:MAG: hypothetical protein H5T69_19430, partial [Chloroflexi bacterium]|nr:hypothetical protein [Chloroflexota bacterium]
FDRAGAWGARGWWAALGRGIALVYLGRGAEAWESFRRASDGAGQLFYLGQRAAEAGEADLALPFYLGAAVVEGEEGGRGRLQAELLCQRYLTNPAVLGGFGEAFCAARIGAQNGNVFVNGQFDAGLQAWRTWAREGLANGVDIDADEGQPAPCALLRSESAKGQANLGQRLDLPAGAQVRLSGRFRVQMAKGGRARLWVIKPVRGSEWTIVGAKVTGESPWAEFSHLYTAPEDEAEALFIYPAVLLGRGVIWVDDVRAELVSPPGE